MPHNKRCEEHTGNKHATVHSSFTDRRGNKIASKDNKF